MLRLPASLGLVWLVALALAQDDDLAAPRPAIALETERPLAFDETECAACHEDIAREWAGSAHALAWLDNAYQKSIRRKRRAKSCYSCHVPELLVQGALVSRVRARTDEESFHLGITCEACHQDPDGVQLGPRGVATDAHPTRASHYMKAPGSNELCTVCHATTIGPVIGIADDLADSGLDDEGLSCVGCHMRPIPRADGDGMRRSHALQTPRDPAFLRRAFELTFTGDEVRIINRTGHRVPGLEGRSIRVELRLLDADGETLEEQEATIDPDAYLPVRGELALPFERSGESVAVRGEHVDPRAKEPVVFLDETLAPEGD